MELFPFVFFVFRGSQHVATIHSDYSESAERFFKTRYGSGFRLATDVGEALDNPEFQPARDAITHNVSMSGEVLAGTDDEA